MKVSELIERLQKLEQDREVTYFDGMYASEINHIDETIENNYLKVYMAY